MEPARLTPFGSDASIDVSPAAAGEQWSHRFRSTAEQVKWCYWFWHQMGVTGLCSKKTKTQKLVAYVQHNVLELSLA